MRKHIFPSLINAYNDWCENNNIKVIEQTIATSLDHWQNIAEQMLALHQQDAKQCSGRIEVLVNDNHI
jgi:hypothetical protein